MLYQRLKASLDNYSKNKSWFWYVPFWLFGLYLFVKLLSFELGGPTAFIIAVPQSFNFFLHEMAHIFVSFLPAIMVAAAGSASELLLGVGLIVGAFLTRSYFAALFCGLWFMLAAHSVADYMADARAQALPLVSFGGSDPTHDWHFIFSELGLLEQDTMIAAITRSLGTLVGLFFLMFSAWLIFKMTLAGQADKAEIRKQEVRREISRLNPADRPNDPSIGEGLYPNATKGILNQEQDKSKKKSG